MSNPDGIDHFFQVPTTGRLVSAIACALWGDAFTDARERGEKTQTCARGSPTPLGPAGTAWSVSLRAHIPSDSISFPLPIFPLPIFIKKGNRAPHGIGDASPLP